jgi:hypothetical protein
LLTGATRGFGQAACLRLHRQSSTRSWGPCRTVKNTSEPLCRPPGRIADRNRGAMHGRDMAYQCQAHAGTLPLGGVEGCEDLVAQGRFDTPAIVGDLGCLVPASRARAISTRRLSITSTPATCAACRCASRPGICRKRWLSGYAHCIGLNPLHFPAACIMALDRLADRDRPCPARGACQSRRALHYE